VTITPHNTQETLLYCQQQHAHLDPPDKYGSTWHNDCQAFCHVAWGIMSGGFGSAYAQWLGLDSEDRHVTLDTSHAPVGALLFSKGTTPFGHIFIAARPFASGTPAGWSTDLWKYGKVGKVARTAPRTAWGHRILGWGTSINGFELDLTGKTAPKPKQNKRYLRIAHAITNLEGALETAQRTKDHHDAVIIKAELHDLKELYGELRHAA